MEKIIETEALTKKFGKVTAVEKVSLSVGRGEIYGFLGLNGAGKTTTIRMLLGMIAPSQGSVSILGEKIMRGGRGPWGNIGSLVEVPHSYPELTVRENLEIFRRLRNIPDAGAVSRVIDLMKLSKYSGFKAGHLSLGNSQRLGLAKALMHGPDILILDEPSNGLDPAGIVEIREMLLELSRDRSVAIFISSHILSEISRTADRIGIIHEGRLVQEINTEELERLRLRHLVFDVIDRRAALALLAKSGYTTENTEDGALKIKDPAAVDHPEKIAALLVNGGVPPKLLKVETEDLEAYFLRIIGRKGDRE